MRRRKGTSGPERLAIVKWSVALTRGAMVLERVLRAFWPAFSLLAFGFAALAFRLHDHLPPDLFFWGLGAWGLAVAVALIRAGLRLRWPTQAEAVARVDARLEGRPLATLADRIALGGDDAATRALWQAHLSRMRQRAMGARPVAPTPDLAPHDPFALRLMAVTAVVMALLFGVPSRMFDPSAPFGRAPGAAEAALGPTWEGWAEPPRYTGKPGLYLNALDADEITVPKGTRFAFRFYGAQGAIPFEETVSNPAAPLETEARTEVGKRDFVAMRGGVIEVGGAQERRFRIEVLADDAPEVSLMGVAERRADGRFAQPFMAGDDYAVVRGVARVRLELGAVDRRYGLALAPEPRDDLVFDLPMPISGSRTAFTETLVEDAARHVWANLPVRLELEVTDGLGQTGRSEPYALDLPGRRFFDPLAAALIEARRDLLWNRENRPRVAQWLRALSYRPEGFIRQDGVTGMLQLVIARLEAGELTDEAREELAATLWEIAELLEDGGLADALAAMQQAQERLSEAIRNGASKDEIAKLMQELKEATDRYIDMLAERAAPEEGPQFGQKQPNQQITGDQIQQMMDEIQRLMEEGRMAEAQELLDQLARMMENLKVTQGQGEGDRQGSQTMRDLQQTLRDQQELSDEAFRDLQNGANGAQPQGEGQQPNGEGEGQSLADRQQDLRQGLGRQQGLMPRLGGEAGDEARNQLDQAGRAMEQAENALRDGDNSAALDRQADAIEALREGMRALGQAMTEDERRQQGQAEGQQRRADGAQGQGSREVPRDPLGRSIGDGTRMTSNENLLQGEDIYRRARDLLDEIRRRSGERLRPEDELDYLKRLLEQF